MPRRPPPRHRPTSAGRSSRAGHVAGRGSAWAAALLALAAAALACEPRKVVDDPPPPPCSIASGAPEGVPAVTALAIDPRAPAVIFAGTVDGLWVSSDCGATFAQAEGPRGVVTAVAPGAEEGSALAAAGGLWSLAAVGGDGAAAAARLSQWVRVVSAAPVDDNPSLVVVDGKLTVASSAGLATFAAGGGDAGDGWQLVEAGGASCIAARAGGELLRCAPGQTRLAASPSDAEVVYAVVASKNGGALSAAVARSTDGGVTFGDAVDVDPVGHAALSGLAVDAEDPLIVYATTTSPAAIYSSDDGGATFVLRKGFSEVLGGTDGSAVAAAETGAAVVRGGHALFTTHDAGVSWVEEPAAAAPSAGVVDVAAGHVLVNIATGVVIDDAAVDLGDRAVAVTHDDSFFYVVTRTQVWQVTLDGGAHVELAQLPRGSISGVAACPTDDVLRVATATATFASGDGGVTFAPVVVDDPGFPGGALAASAVGVLAANGGSHSFFMRGDDIKLVGGAVGDSFTGAASSPTSRTAWLVGATALLLSLDGGDTFDATALQAPAHTIARAAALDGDALALAVADDDDATTATVVDVDHDGTARIRHGLDCVPSALATVPGALVAGGGTCPLTLHADP